MSGTYIDREIELSAGSVRMIQCVSMPAQACGPEFVFTGPT